MLINAQDGDQKIIAFIIFFYWKIKKNKYELLLELKEDF